MHVFSYFILGVIILEGIVSQISPNKSSPEQYGDATKAKYTNMSDELFVNL